MRWKRIITRTTLVIIVCFAGISPVDGLVYAIPYEQNGDRRFFKGKMYAGNEYSYYVGRQKINYWLPATTLSHC